METTKLNLYQKLLEIQKAIIGLGKDGQSFGYKYVSGSKALSHIKPLMNQYGLILKQEILTISNVRQDYATKTGNKSEILTTTTQKFTWVDCETGEKDENLFAANGQNDWEKGLGSALTYAERYFLLKYFHIATDEDDIDNPNREKTPAVLPPAPAPVAPKEKHILKAGTPEYDNACKAVKGEVANAKGKFIKVTIEQLETKYQIPEDVKSTLTDIISNL